MKIVSTDDIKNLGTILCLGAHPDDETYTAGGILAAAAANGQQVVCITATRGEQGVQDERRWPRASLAATREAELASALAVLGVKNHHWLSYKDGCCGDVSSADAVDALRPLLLRYQPDTILTFGPDGMTGHEDHSAVSNWAAAAKQELGLKANMYHAVIAQDIYDDYLQELDKHLNMFFNIDKPPLRQASVCDISFQLTDDICVQKCNALRAMPSQTSGLFKRFTTEWICRAWAKETFVKT